MTLGDVRDFPRRFRQNGSRRGVGLWWASLLLVLAQGCAAKEPVVAETGPEEKIARVLELEERRSLGGGELVSRLRDPSSQVRARAALALGRLSRPETVTALSELLSDSSIYVRETAAFSLGILDADLPAEVVERLSRATNDESPAVRARALEALSRRGATTVESIAQALLGELPAGSAPHEWTEETTSSAVRPPHIELRLGLFSFARRAQADDLRWAWPLLATEGGTPRFLWWPAAWVVSELEGEQRLPLLLYYAGHPDPEFRLLAARGLTSLSIDRARDPVLRLLADPNERVLIQAIRAATALGLETAGPELLRFASSGSVAVRSESLKALAVIRHPEATEAIIDALSDPRAAVRALAWQALARQDVESLWLLLAGIGADPDWEVRAAIAELMGSSSDRRARARLVSIFEEEQDSRVRARALSGLSGADPELQKDLAIEGLESRDPFERAAAATLLGRIGQQTALAPLEQAFGSDRDRNFVARSAILTALDQLDEAAARRTAREAMADDALAIRLEAAAILRRGGEASEPASGEVPETSSHSAYLALATPQFTPQAFVRTTAGTVELELFVLDAPLTVRNFIELARKDFYNGTRFHEVVPNDHLSAGDPRGDGRGGAGHTIRREINPRPIVRGTLAMDLEGVESSGSRFFFATVPHPELDGVFTVFGQVVRGMDILDRIEPGDRIEEVRIWDGLVLPDGPDGASGDRSSP